MSDEIKAKIIIEADTSGAEEAASALEKLQGATGASAEGAGSLGDQLAAMEKQAGSTAGEVVGLAEETKGLEEATTSGEEAVSSFNDVLDEHQQALEEAQSAHESLQPAIEETNKSLTSAQETLAKSTPVVSQYAENIQSAQQAMQEFNQSDPWTNMASGIDNVNQSLSDSQIFNAENIKSNMAAFSEAVNSPDVTDPLAHIQTYLDQTGQSWENFTGTIGEGRMNALYDMVDQFGETYQVLSDTSTGFEQADKSAGTFTDTVQNTAAAMDEFNQADPWAAFNAGATDASKAVEGVGAATEQVSKANEGFFSSYFGGLGDSIFGGAAGEAGSVSKGLLGSIGDIAGGFDAFMRPLMMGQMAVQMVAQVGQAIYNSAAIAEGPGAHSIGTFTGAVDSLGVTAQNVGSSFSEAFGQQFTATVGAVNQALGDNQTGLNSTGGMLGGALSFASNLLMGGLGVGLMATGVGIPLGFTMTQAGMEGVANNLAEWNGQPPEFTGQQATPGMEVQSQVQQGWSQIPTNVIKGTSDSINNTNQILTEASDPSFIDAQNQLSHAQQYLQHQQQQYNAAHPYNQQSEALQSANDYSTMQEGYAVTHPDTYWNDAMKAASQGNWFGGFGANQSGGGFWANIGQIFAGGPQDAGTTLGMDSGAAFSNWIGGMGTNAANSTSSFLGGLGNDFMKWWDPTGDLSNLGSTGGGCFPAGTLVLLADHTAKPIESLHIGDTILAHDGTRRVTTTVLARIVPPARMVYKLTFSDGHALTLTDSHPISTPQGWKALSVDHAHLENPDLLMSALQIGDAVHTIDGIVSLMSIEPREVVQVYNVSVGEPHTFYAGGVLVHNKANMTNAGVGSETVSGSGGVTQLAHTFTADVTWEANNLTKQFTAAAQWAEQNLLHAVTAVANWAEQGIEHAVTAVANWAEEGVQHAVTAVANWAEQGVEHAVTAVANWAEQNVIHSVVAAAQWAEQNLIHSVTAAAQWAEKNLEHEFLGVASWIGQNLFHTFVGVAQWIQQTITSVIPGFAEGVSNYSGGAAIVGEAGAEVIAHNGQYALVDGPTFVNLPSGASVYPMQELSGSSPRMYASGTGDSVTPISLGGVGGSSGAHTANINVYLDSSMLIQMLGASLFQTINVGLGKRSY